MDYLDFEVALEERAGGDFLVRLLDSPVGQAREVTRFPIDQDKLSQRLEMLRETLTRARSGRDVVPDFDGIAQSSHAAARDLGGLLFDVLFPGEIGRLYADSLREASRNDLGLRLKLRTQAPELATLPWEFVYDHRRGDFVCLSKSTPLVRYLELPHPPAVLSVTPPLRIIGMVASPVGLPVLDVERERARMETSMAELRRRGVVDITWLQGQTWVALKEAMGPGGGGPWHVFHFIGHGGFDARTNEGYLALATEQGDRYDLTATGLGRLLGDCRSVRLAVLNACEGARGGGPDIFSSMAATLMHRGLAAVVSMQHEISDQAAIEFSRDFYRSLAEGYPVDAAVAEARKAVSFALPRSVEWATPVLHMRSPDGRLFDFKGATLPPPPRPVLQAVPAQVDFGQVQEGATPLIPVRVKNVGGGTLNWSFKTTGGFFTASRTDDGLSLVLEASRGTHHGAVQISSNGGEVMIEVRAEIRAPAASQIPELEKPRIRRASRFYWRTSTVLLVLWFLGLVSSYTMGGFIHILLVLAVALALVGIVVHTRHSG